MRFAILAICFCISFDAFAQHSSVVSKLLPARGSYYDRAKPGTGIEVDVDGNGLLFIAFNSYSPAGAPVWYLIQGSFQPASEAQRLATDTIGGITSPLLLVSGGQCISCDFTSMASVAASPNVATLTWTTSRHVDMVIGNQAWHMDAAEYTIADADLFPGTWLMAISWDTSAAGAVASQPVAARTAIVTLRASLRNLPEVGFGPRFALGSANSGIRLPPSGSMIYVFDCGFNFGASVPCPASSLWTDIFSVLGLDLAATAPTTPIELGHPNPFRGGPFIWFDPVSRRAGLDVVSTRTPGIDTELENIGPSNLHFDLYFDADRIVGHGIMQGPNPGTSLDWQPGRVALNLVMTRLASGVVERCVVACPAH
jgi:hypothetical protein